MNKNTFFVGLFFAVSAVGFSYAENLPQNRIGLLEKHNMGLGKITKSVEEDKAFLLRWKEVKDVEPAAGKENYGYSDKAINHFHKALEKFK